MDYLYQLLARYFSPTAPSLPKSKSASLAKMERRSTFTKPRADQTDCPLFGVLPGEVRDRIFEYALRSFDDTCNAYSKDESYRRPGYLAPSKADRALLQTCQQVYAEAWFWPWATATHTFWLGECAASV